MTDTEQTAVNSRLPVVRQPAAANGRRIRRILLAAALAVAAAAAAAVAQDTGLNWTVYGPGVSTCKEWTAARQQGGGADAALRAWVAGFMSAASYYHTLLGDTLARLPVVSVDDQAKWIDARCAANPTEVLAVASRNMLTAFAEGARRK